MFDAALFSFLVNGELPSGQGDDDIWEYLQLYLWFEDRKAAAKKKEIAAASAKSKREPIVLTGSETEVAGAGNGAEGVGASGAKGGGAVKSFSPTELSAAAARALEAADARRKAGEGAGADQSSKGTGASEDAAESDDGATKEVEGMAEIAAGVKREKTGEEEEEEEEEVAIRRENEGELIATYGEPSNNWIHPASLVFAAFGRPAGKNEDVDLKLGMNDGRAGGSKRSASPTPSGSASPTSESGTPLSTKGLKLMNGAGGHSSRAAMKKVKHEVNKDNKNIKAAEEDAALRRRALEAMTAPPVDSKSALELSANVALLTKAVVSKERLDQEAAQRARYNALVESKNNKLQMLERRGKGGSPAAQQLEDELSDLYDNPIIAPLPVAASPVNTSGPATPSLAEGDGDGSAAGGQQADGGGELVDELVDGETAGATGAGSGSEAGGSLGSEGAASAAEGNASVGSTMV